MGCGSHRVGRWWKHFVIFLAPLVLLLPLMLIPETEMPKKASQCLYVMLLMATYWCTEVLPLAVTGLIPVFMFPMLGILSTEEVCNQYLKDTVMMFVGGLMVALSVEKCNLHRRIAVSVLHLVGTKPMWLMLGFMLPTWFLSMWISNTATTSMMLPIAEAILLCLTRSEEEERAKLADTYQDETVIGIGNDGYVNEEKPPLNGAVNSIEQHTEDIQLVVIKGDISNDHPDMMKKIQFSVSDQQSTTSVPSSQIPSNNADTPEEVRDYKSTGSARLDKFAKGMTLAVAYAANTGGTATLIGTGPNPVMKDHADAIWQDHGYVQSPVTFASWFVMGFPIACINLIFVWLWLVVFFNGISGLCPCKNDVNEEDEAIKRVVDDEYKLLGKMRYAEVMVSFMFVSMVLLWFFQSPGFMTGWADVATFIPGYIDDAVVSIFIAFMLCIIPSKLPSCKETGPVDTLLDWGTVHKKIPWGIVFLMGGGFCIAKACESSGLSDWIAEKLQVMADWPGWVMVLTICLITAFLTEITSNVATCTILMPIVSSLAEGIGRNPLYLMFPVALSTSFAFMLPVATPPNAVAFSYGRLKILDMVKAGFILNFICVGVVTMATHTWGNAYFNFDELPWAANSTIATTSIP